MKFSDKKAVGRLQPITLGGTRIYTSYTGGKPWPGSGSSAAWPNFFRFGQHRRHYSAATAPLPPPLCAANRGILYYFFCNKTSHRQRSPCSKSETIAQNLLRERLVRERESHRVIYLEDLDRNVVIPILAPSSRTAVYYAPVYELLQVGNA